MVYTQRENKRGEGDYTIKLKNRQRLGGANESVIVGYLGELMDRASSGGCGGRVN